MDKKTRKEAAERLRDLISPDKTVSVFCELLAQRPDLWKDTLDILKHPNTAINSDNLSPLRSVRVIRSRNKQRHNRLNHKLNNFDSNCANSVFQQLNTLQLEQLPDDILGLIVNHLTFEENVCWSLCNRFFSINIPKLIQSICLLNGTYPSLNNVFAKAQRLRLLTIENDFNFRFPFNCLRTLRCVELSDIQFTAPFRDAKTMTAEQIEAGLISILEKEACAIVRDRYSAKNKVFSKYGKETKSGSVDKLNMELFPLETLQLYGCINLSVKPWLYITNKTNAPHLKALEISTHCSTNMLQRCPKATTDNSIERFSEEIFNSNRHNHIQKLSLITYELDIMRSLVQGCGCRTNLIKLELGIMDHKHVNGTPFDVEPLFLRLIDGYGFPQLRMLIIDFAPQPFSNTDISDEIQPRHIEAFASSIPSHFPKLKLLALYSSHTQLLFGDDHFRALMKTPLPNIVDLSVGFELLNCGLISELAHSNCFPNLVWLTIETLSAQASFEELQSTVKNVNREQHLKTLEWVTVCVFERESIHDLENGISIECWNRGVDECEFDEALKRSEDIASTKNQ